MAVYQHRVIGEDLLSTKFWLQMFVCLMHVKKSVCNACTQFFMETKLTIYISHNNIMRQVGIPPNKNPDDKVIYYK